MARYFWTNKDIQIIRQYYPGGGTAACLEKLPGRTQSAIYGKAAALGLHHNQDFTKRKAWTTSEYIDGEIIRVYQAKPRKDEIRKLASRLCRPRWWVSKRAMHLGLVLPRFKEPEWSEEEIELLGENIHKSLKIIRKIFQKHGFVRSETAIKVKSKRPHLNRSMNGSYTANQVADLMGVDRKTVSRYIEAGLAYRRRETARTVQQGGDMYEIRDRDIRNFVVANPGVIDIRKVDKFWFIDLLAGGSSCAK